MRPEYIARRAYALWVRRGSPPGTELQDWLEAEAELLRMQEALRAHDGPPRVLPEPQPAIFWTTDAALRITSARGTGLSRRPEEVVGLSLDDFFPSADARAAPITAHLRALGGEAVAYEQVGKGRTWRAWVEPLRDERGATIGCVGTAVDLSEDRRGEKALHRVHQELNEQVMKGAAELERVNAALRQLLEERTRSAEELRHQHAVLRAILDGTTDAVFVKDLQGRYLLINEAGARFLGRTVAEVLGKDDTELFSPDTAGGIMAGDRLVLATGRTQTIEDVGTSGGRTRTYLATKGVCRDADGRVIGSFGISRDITDRKHAEQRLAAEHAVARVLANAGGLAEAAPGLLQAVCSNLDWCAGAVWVLDRQAQLMRCQEVWHVSSHPVPEFEALSRRLTFGRGDGLIGAAWAGGEPLWFAEVPEPSLLRRAAAARREGLHGAFAFPILLSSGVHGVIEFYSAAPRELEPDLLEVMGCICSQVGQFLERREAEKLNTEREKELSVARKIQEGLLPRAAPVVAGLDMAGACRPASATGGDYFDYLPLPDGSVGIAVGDASGHGVGAALLIVQTQAYLRSVALGPADFERILPLTNARLADGGLPDGFVTVLLARIDPVRRALTYASAGHPAALVLGSAGQVKARLPATGCPLGAFPAWQSDPVGEWPLEPGDLVALITDGVLENESPEGAPFGVARVLEVLRAHRDRPARELADALLDAVAHFCGDAPPQDDMTVVVIKVSG